jgi:diacylglycerol kinase (ATP)
VTRILLVANQASGSGDGPDPATTLRDRGHDVVAVEIEAIDDLTAHADTAPELRGIERVVVAGGDGSIAPVAALALRLGVPLGVVPSGTANDFARALQLPTDLEAALFVAADGTQTRALELGVIDGRPFVNVASFGMAPTAASAAHGLKDRLGSLAYPLGALVGIARAKPVDVTATVDGDVSFSGSVWQAMLAITGAFGGIADVGATHMSDGQLDLVIVPADRATRDLVIDMRALLRGELAERDGVHHVRGSSISLAFTEAPEYVFDGEERQAQRPIVEGRVHDGLFSVVTS